MISNALLGCWLVLLLSACANEEAIETRTDQLPFYLEASFTPHWIDPLSEEIKNIHSISPFEFINQEGDTISQTFFDGKIYITDFFFTSCPGICTQMAANMSILQDSFLHEQDVLLLSHSVTPNKDSVPVLKNYAEAKGISSKKWHLVTGDRSEIYKLGRKDYFVEEDLGINKSDEEFLHTENFVLIDRNRHIRGIYNGLNKVSINQLIADVHLLIQE